ncbi:hypothetical protein SNEBB_001549 [Seison nebaliae]|nr:hypothetical protein SNEBB_001549 [Seison nebaliae]
MGTRQNEIEPALSNMCDKDNFQSMISFSNSEEKCCESSETSWKSENLSFNTTISDKMSILKEEKEESTMSTTQQLDDEKMRNRLDYLLKKTETFAEYIKYGGKQKAMSEEGNKSTELIKLQDKDICNSQEGLIHFDESPYFIENGEMRDYQVRGLNWMISCFSHNINCILADEMGLGKTLQTISLIAYHRFFLKKNRYFLIIVPKSTITNWQNEFEKWCPGVFRILMLFGEKYKRRTMIRQRNKNDDFDVVITTYEMSVIEKAFLRKYRWEILVVDEAHRLKNEKSKLAIALRTVMVDHRLLVTGTPLQNNLHELWALLNFLLPEIFNSAEDFDIWFNTNNCINNNDLILRLHSILNPFLLRRMKSDVEKSLKAKEEVKLYVRMANIQREVYKKILAREFDMIRVERGSEKKITTVKLNNIFMQLRKCANHPYLLPNIEPGPPYTTDEHLVESSGKLKVLDKLLKRLKMEGHRVLLFSGFVIMLNIIEDYLIMRKFKYARIDGGTNYEDRQNFIDEYNKPDSSLFIFIISTRAGGLGINLATADTVIFYDSDYNPQIDLQATDRAHRIGQKNIVKVFRLLSEHSVDERTMQLAEKKLRLDHVIIQNGRSDNSDIVKLNKETLLSVIRCGAQQLFCGDDNTTITDTDLDDVLKRGEERTRNEKNEMDKLSENELKNFAFDNENYNMYMFEGMDYKDCKYNNDGNDLISSSKRTRKIVGGSNDDYFKLLNQVPIVDFQFFPPQLAQLQKMEFDYFKKMNDFLIEEELSEKERMDIINSRPLTEEEQIQKQNFISQGFTTWTRREFTKFIQLNEKFGRNNVKVLEEIPSKKTDEIREYHTVFWKRYKEIDGHEKIIEQIERGENNILKRQYIDQLIDERINSPFFSRMDLPTHHIPNPKGFTESEDRFLLEMIYKFTLDCEHLSYNIHRAIRQSPMFSYNLTFRSRGVYDIYHRCAQIISCLEREDELRGEESAKVVNTPGIMSGWYLNLPECDEEFMELIDVNTCIEEDGDETSETEYEENSCESEDDDDSDDDEEEDEEEDEVDEDCHIVGANNSFCGSGDMIM